MKKSLRVALAQINPTVGDLAGNANLILDHCRSAAQAECDLVVFPELALTGYPPEDLLFKSVFVNDNLAALERLANRIKDITAVVGFVDTEKEKIFNAAAWISNGKVRKVYRKRCLPNYGVFDENRYFTPGNSTVTETIKGVRVGLTICEDIWISGPHIHQLKSKKPDLVLNLSASPFHVGKLAERHKAIQKNVRALSAPVLYCNMMGGQDELVFDGGSFGLLPSGRVMGQAPLFETGLFVFGLDLQNKKPQITSECPPVTALSPIEETHKALVIGIRDYVQKNGFSKVALGVSGGIDSALVAALAVEALGAQNVVGVTMPSQYNSTETKNDAALLMKNLNTKLLEIPIQPMYGEFLKALTPWFQNTNPNEAEENIQARVRGTLLMALSNKFGWLVLTTGNKSEMSTGYCTLYGDTAGGFSVLKDVLKTTVFQLARHINAQAGREVIPESTINRPPTAELRANQKDEDSLGAYADLDPVIVGYVENNQSLKDLTKQNPGKAAFVSKTLTRIDRNEYKRRQAPLGIKITPRSFGRDHRMPITNRYNPS